MDIRSKEGLQDIITKGLWNIHNRHVEMTKRLDDNYEEHLEYLRELYVRFSQPTSGSIIAKTPKISRKRAIKRIETIPENDVFQHQNTLSSSIQSVKEEKEGDEEEVAPIRKSRRVASQRAANNIRRQNNSPMSFKRPKKLNDETSSISSIEDKRESHLKRKKRSMSNSDEEDSRSAKHSKLEENLIEKRESARKVTHKQSGQIVQSSPEKLASTETKEQDIVQKSKHSTKSKSKESQTKMKKANDVTDKQSGQIVQSSPKKVANEETKMQDVIQKSRRSTTSKSKESQKVDDIIIAPTENDTEELSMYEDAIGKPTPIMNSTRKHSSVLPEKMLNVTVVLEPMPQMRKLNETIVIHKASSQCSDDKTNSIDLKKPLQDARLRKMDMQDIYNELITEDESSPELEKRRIKITKKQKKRVLSSDDEIPNTPEIQHIKEIKAPAAPSEAKTMYKSGALFSPYAKESVKKRVEAFEQVVMHSPKLVSVDVPTRITRTKTRAMAAAEAEQETKNTDKNVTQVLARKSLAKAKKIAHLVEKQKKDEELKENKEPMPERIKLHSNDKLNTKQIQLKITPLNKKVLPPLSVNRFNTPSNTQVLPNYSKTQTAPRANIVTNMDSFIQPPKTISKTNSTEKSEEKKRHEDDAKKKREETLRLLTEEKRRKRQQKELKNKLAREAKEKQEWEKRQKAERDREERARLAQLLQEKQREEIEKRRLAQLQRAQETEERRKLEEQQRLQRLQEQEEAERLLAEQKRREQEAEKRKEAGARAQQQVAAEMLRQKQLLAAHAKYKLANKQQGATNYVLDSEPDDDESDDETKPKYEIPYWAQANVRKTQLAMQRHIPEEIIYKFFDTRKCTPDLTELFHGIDQKRLKRTSSAIWKTPPRFSMMETE